MACETVNSINSEYSFVGTTDYLKQFDYANYFCENNTYNIINRFNLLLLLF